MLEEKEKKEGDMVRVRPLTKHEVKGEAKKILKESERQFGLVFNIFATIVRHPKALKPILDLYNTLAKESAIEPRLQELANLETARVNKCHSCFAHHSPMAKEYGITNKQIEMIHSGKIDTGFSDKEKTVLEYARWVTKNPARVSGKLFKRLQSYFTANQIVSLTLIIALMTLFNRFNGALRVELEERFK